jgi:hypothetical protein
MNRLKLKSGIVGAAIVTVVVVIAWSPWAPSTSPGRNDRAPSSSSGKTEAVAPAPPSSPVDEGVASRAKARTASNTSWSEAYNGSRDYWAFVDKAVTAAADGNTRAQFLVGEALTECRNTVLISRKFADEGMTAAEIFEKTFWRNASKSLSAAFVEYSRREFMKCAKFFDGDPPALETSTLGSEAGAPDYWRNLALANGDPLAVMQQVTLQAGRLGSEKTSDNADAIRQIEEGVRLVVASADPEALLRLSGLVGYLGSKDPIEGPAWALAACSSGLDCSSSNPAFGHDCAALGLCNGGESVESNLQQSLGGRYGEAYARSQDIAYQLAHGDPASVAQTLLAELNLADRY